MSGRLCCSEAWLPSWGKALWIVRGGGGDGGDGAGRWRSQPGARAAGLRALRPGLSPQGDDFKGRFLKGCGLRPGLLGPGD